MGAVVVVFVIAFIVLYVVEQVARASVRQGRASLAENLPPDVQADMKPNLFNLLGVLAFAAVVFLSVWVDLLTSTRLGRNILLIAGGLVATVAFAARTAWIARFRLDRKYLGEVLVDLSPNPLAGALRLKFGVLSVMCFLGICAMIGTWVTGFHWDVGWLLLAVCAAIPLLFLWLYLKRVDHIWLAERGLCFNGGLYPWDGFERLAWTNDGRAFALRRRSPWRFQRWTVVPVRNGSRQAAEKALRRLMPARTLTQ